MGANAVTTVPVYASGEVLTAANLNITNSGIPVFADSSARDNSFGGTGEKVLAEGQFAFLEDSNTTQYYDGANWQPVGTTPGLVFIAGATFSSVTSVSLPNDTFTAAYRNYRVILESDNPPGNIGLRIRMRAAGSDNTTSNYVGGTVTATTGAATFPVGNNNTTAFLIADAGNTFTILAFDVLAPKATAKTKWGGALTGTNGSTTIGGAFAGGFNATTSFDALTIKLDSSSFSGTIRTYGYGDS